jgi:sirohydrochlorin cobaltochelatase
MSSIACIPHEVVLATGLRHNLSRGEEAPVFTQDALLLVGHGSTKLPGAARPLLAHADVIRSSGRFAEVAAGALLGEPDAASVFNALTAPVVHVVPCFLEDGYFTRIAIPELLLPLASPSRVIRFCHPVGLNDGIAELIEARVTRHCELFGSDPKTLSVLLVGHGSARGPGRARALRHHAARIEARHRFGWVRVAHLEEAPFVPEALASTRGHVVAVVGYLANEGMHVTKDLPDLIATERAERGTHWPPVHYLGSIGADEAMPRLLVDMVTGSNGK